MHRTIRLALLLALTAGSAFAQQPTARTPTPPVPPPSPAATPPAASQPPAAPPAPAAAAPPVAQPGAQSALPHAWLFGSWTGGVFPAPVTLSAQECLANPSVIFTRDVILRAVPTDVTYTQILIESARAIPGGAEFRLTPSAQPASGGGAFGIGTPASQPAGFGCDSPGILRVQRRGEDQIAFPSCSDFPYPLVRCPAH